MDFELPNFASKGGQPFTATELRIAALWKEVLELTHAPDRDDNFFALGGDSIAMIAVELRINEEFMLNLPAGTVLGTPSLCGIADLVENYSNSRCESDETADPRER